MGGVLKVVHVRLFGRPLFSFEICLIKDEGGLKLLQSLKEIFPSMTFYSEVSEDEQAQYAWFMSGTEEVIGVLKEQITHKELAILQTFLTPYEVQFPVLTDKEKQWHAFLQKETTSLPVTKSSFRFVAFSFKRNQINPTQFKNAICELFAYEVPILWKSEYEGIIVEEIENEEECTSYEQIIDILMSDLYVKIQFLVGPFNHTKSDAHLAHHFIEQASLIIFEHSNKSVMTYIEAVPYYLIYHNDASDRKNVQEMMLQELADDEELLKMIETFIDQNLNLSETAKVLHLHRNSLQYRIDRLYEKVGIDIRNFHHAIALYLSGLVKR